MSAETDKLVADAMATLGVVESYLRRANGDIGFSFSPSPGTNVKTSVLEEIARIMRDHEPELTRISDKMIEEMKE